MVVFAIHLHVLAMGAHVSPHPEPVSHLPPGPIPLGCPRAPALLGWFLSSYEFCLVVKKKNIFFSQDNKTFKMAE